MTGMTGKPLLLVVHHGASDVARIGPILDRLGIASRIVWPLEGGELPSRLEDHAGAIVFGGAMGANDHHFAGIRAELQWIGRALSADFPLFGICLGAQMIARTLGASVGEHPQGQWEIGYTEIAPTAAGETWFGTSPRMFYQWHKDGFDLPQGATLLARGGDGFTNQAFSHGRNTIAVQFHPEVEAQHFQRWHADTPGADMRKGAHPLDRQLDDDARYRHATLNWLEEALSNWLPDHSSNR